MKDNNYDTQQNKGLLNELFDGKFYVFVRSFVCAYHFLYNHTKNINKADKLAVALTIVFFDNLESGNITPDMINNCLPGDSDIPLNDLITSTVIKTALTIDNEVANNNEKALNESQSIIADEVMDAFSRATSLAEYKGEYNYNEILKKAAERGYINPIPQPSQEVSKENSIPFSASTSPSTSDLSAIANDIKQAYELLYNTINKALIKEDFYPAKELYPFLFVLFDYLLCDKPHNLRAEIAYYITDKAKGLMDVEYLNKRNDQYSEFIRGKPADSEWSTFRVQNSNPIINLAIAFGDFVWNPKRIDNYDKCPLMMHPLDKSVSFSITMTDIVFKDVAVAVKFVDELFHKDNTFTGNNDISVDSTPTHEQKFVKLDMSKVKNETSISNVVADHSVIRGSKKMKVLFTILSVVGAGELLNLGQWLGRSAYEAGLPNDKIMGYKWGFAVLAVLWVVLNVFTYNQLKMRNYNNAVKKIEANAKAEGVTFEEYISSHVPQRCVDICESSRGDKEELNKWLDTCVKNGSISKELKIYLYEEYM